MSSAAQIALAAGYALLTADQKRTLDALLADVTDPIVSTLIATAYITHKADTHRLRMVRKAAQ